MAMVAPPGVVMIQAACPHQVAVVTPAAGAARGRGRGGGGLVAGGTTGRGNGGGERKAAANGNQSFFMGSLLATG